MTTRTPTKSPVFPPRSRLAPAARRPPTTLTETSKIGPVVAPFGGPVPPQQTVTVNADLRREYVTGAGWGWISAYASTLPQYIDDVTMQFGRDLYRRMRRDAQVESANSTFIMAMLAEGMQLGPNVDKGKPGYDDSKTIADFCHTNIIERLECPITDTLAEMGLATSYGYKAAEQTYELVDWRGQSGPRLALKSLHTKPQDSTAFVVDAFNNILGLVYTRPGAPIPAISFITPSMLTGASAASGAVNSGGTGVLNAPIIVPRSKFWIFTWQAENNDPRGTSILRPAYHAWWVKGQVWRSYLAWLATFAQPSVIGYVSANAEPTYIYDQNGNPKILQTPQEVMKVALESIQNGAVGAFAADERVELLQPRSEGAAFVQAINVANREITKAIIRQTLTTDEGEHMARAASEVHQDVFGLLVRFGKSSLIGSFRRDVLRPLVAYNFGEDAARDYLPNCTLGATEHQDFANDANAVSALVRAGFFDESQYRDLDAFLGLPPRDPETWARKLEQAEMLVELATNTAPGTPGATGPGGAVPDNSAGAGARAPNTSGQSLVSQDTSTLTARLVGKASAMRLANRVGVVGPA